MHEDRLNSEKSFWRKLDEMKKGIRKNGIVCLVMNSGVTEKDKRTGENLPPQFEVNLSTDELLDKLDKRFLHWKKLKVTVRKQQYEIPREQGISQLKTEVVTYVARREE